MGRSLLLLVSGFLIIFGIIQNSTQNRQRMLEERAPEYYYREQSRNIAGAMLEVALGNINSGTNYLMPNKINNVSIDMMSGTGKVKIDSTSNFKSQLFITITGEIEKPDDKTAITTIKAVFNRKAFSIYAYFSNTEPSNYVFVSGDEYNGPVHTNGRINFLGDPVFNGPLTTHQGYHNYTGNSNPVYNDTHDFDAPFVKLPDEVPEVVSMADEEGLKYSNKIKVEFKKNGMVKIREYRCKNDLEDKYGDCKNGEKKISKHDYKMSEFNGVISSTENVQVEGTLNGQVTLHSKKDVIITGDVVYENRNYNDKSKPITDDMLGIISEGETVIDKEAHIKGKYKGNKGKDDDEDDDNDNDDDNGKGNKKKQDIHIDASILALGGRFYAEDFNVRGTPDRGTVYLLGGAIQRDAGSMGLVSGNGTHLGGYSSNNWSYDTRFAENSTPGFPRKERFEIENWRESTTTKPTDK